MPLPMSIATEKEKNVENVVCKAFEILHLYSGSLTVFRALYVLCTSILNYFQRQWKTRFSGYYYVFIYIFFWPDLADLR